MNPGNMNLLKTKKLFQPYSSSASYLSSLEGMSKNIEDSLSEDQSRVKLLSYDHGLESGLQNTEGKSEVNKSHPFLK
jgi:hypothetical protein